ncbi:hypothetical protein [Nocardioides sp. P5_E3]
MTNHRPRTLAAALAAFTIVIAAAPATLAAPAESYRLSFIPAPPSPEDIIAVPGTRKVVVSALAADPLAEGSVGHLYAMDATTRKATEIWPDAAWRTAWDKDTYPDCPGPPDPTKASPHGINIATDAAGRSTLYVVNHGGREAIEVFRIRGGKNETLRLTWKGCAEMPAGTFPNGVAPLPDRDGFVVSNFLDPTSANPFAGMFTGAKTGDVREWTPRRGWRTVPRSALGGANGIEVTPDGRAVIVAAWGERKLYRIPLRRDIRSQTRTWVQVPMKPDNLRWTADGRLLLTGQDITEQQFLACETGNLTGCPTGVRVLRVNPNTMRVRTILHSDTKRFRVPTVAAPVGDDVWVGTVKGNTIARLRSR